MLKRISTAIIFAIIMLGGLFGGRYSFVFLFALITILCLWEFFNIVLKTNSRSGFVRKVIGTCLGILPFIISSLVQLDLVGSKIDFITLSSLLVSPFIFTAFIFELYTRSEQPFTNIAFIVLGMVYIGIPFAMLDFIAFDGNKFYANIVFGLLMLTWMNDTGAYLVGSTIGRTPLLPRISPNKTWEGAIGGAVLCLLLVLGLHYFFNEIGLVNWLVLGFIVIIFGSLGDLVESMLKRSMQIKDSGNLLPGHGGVLDRFDGFIFLLPFCNYLFALDQISRIIKSVFNNNFAFGGFHI